MEELDYVITRLKKNKAPGPDEVRAEITLLLNYWGEQDLLKNYQSVLPGTKSTSIMAFIKSTLPYCTFD